MEGALMISDRKDFQKVYDLTERVLPKNVNTDMPSNEEVPQLLILSWLKIQSFAMAFLLWLFCFAFTL